TGVAVAGKDQDRHRRAPEHAGSCGRTHGRRPRAPPTHSSLDTPTTRPLPAPATMRTHVAIAALLFLVAFAVRWTLLQGLVLGDDPQEFAVLLHILSAGPLWSDQLHLRFAGWIFNHLAFWAFGVSEAAFLAPTALLTSTMPIMAYAI